MVLPAFSFCPNMLIYHQLWFNIGSMLKTLQRAKHCIDHISFITPSRSIRKHLCQKSSSSSGHRTHCQQAAHPAPGLKRHSRAVFVLIVALLALVLVFAIVLARLVARIALVAKQRGELLAVDKVALGRPVAAAVVFLARALDEFDKRTLESHNQLANPRIPRRKDTPSAHTWYRSPSVASDTMPRIPVFPM